MQRVTVKIDPETAKKMSPERQAGLISAARKAGLMVLRILDAQGLEWDPENGGPRPKRARRPANRKRRGDDALGGDAAPPTREEP